MSYFIATSDDAGKYGADPKGYVQPHPQPYDNRIDITVLPTKPGEKAKIEWRPKTAAFTVTKDVMTVAAGQKTDVTLKQSGAHAGLVSGQIAPVPGLLDLLEATGLGYEELARAELTVLINTEALHDRELRPRDWQVAPDHGSGRRRRG